MKKLCFFSLFFISCFLWADYFEIKAEELEAKGIRYKFLEPINLTENGDCFVAIEAIQDVETKAKGYTKTLRIFRFSNQKLVKIEEVKIPVTQWVNGSLGTGKRANEMMILGNHGTKMVHVDLKTLEVKVLFEHQKGKPGFKAGPFLGCGKEEFFTTGWAYDKEQYWEGDYLIKLQPTSNKLNFSSIQGVDLKKLFQEGDGFVKAYYYISHEKILYNWVVPDEKKTYLKLYDKGTVTNIDSGYQLNIFVGCENKVFYSVIGNKQENILRHYIVDFKDVSKKIQVGQDNAAYTYPFLSGKGDVLVVVTLDPQNITTCAYFGTEKNAYTMKKFLHNVSIGPMKLSNDGKVFLIMNPKGIRIIPLQDSSKKNTPKNPK